MVSILGKIFGRRGKNPESITIEGTDQHNERKLGIAKALSGFDDEEFEVQKFKNSASGVRTDWYVTEGNSRKTKRIRIEQAAKTEQDQKDILDQGIVDENKYHSSDATNELSSKGQPPCKRRQKSTHS